MIQMLQTQREKDYKQLVANKKMQERQISELRAEIDRLTKVIEEKDKDIRLQALRLRELMHDEFRKQTIKKNYEELAHLAQSPRSGAGQPKLEERKSILQKYGRLPLKPGFHRKILDYSDKLAILDIKQRSPNNSVSRALSVSRSRSVDPAAKVKRHAT